MTVTASNVDSFVPGQVLAEAGVNDLDHALNLDLDHRGETLLAASAVLKAAATVAVGVITTTLMLGTLLQVHCGGQTRAGR
jgi:hypothetical protein